VWARVVLIWLGPRVLPSVDGRDASKASVLGGCPGNVPLIGRRVAPRIMAPSPVQPARQLASFSQGLA